MSTIPLSCFSKLPPEILPHTLHQPLQRAEAKSQEMHVERNIWDDTAAVVAHITSETDCQGYCPTSLCPPVSSKRLGRPHTHSIPGSLSSDFSGSPELWLNSQPTTLHMGTPTVPLSSQCLHPLALIEWNITWDSPHHFSATVTFSPLAYIQVEEVGFVTSSRPMSPPNLISPPHLFIILFSIKHAIQLLHPFLLISNWNRTLPSSLTVPGMTNWKI